MTATARDWNRLELGLTESYHFSLFSFCFGLHMHGIDTTSKTNKTAEQRPLKTSNNQRLADFHLLSLAKINIFKKKLSDPDVLQAYITQSQNPRQYFPVVFCLASRGPFYTVLSIRSGSQPKQPTTGQSLADYFRLTLLVILVRNLK